MSGVPAVTAPPLRKGSFHTLFKGVGYDIEGERAAHETLYCFMNHACHDNPKADENSLFFHFFIADSLSGSIIIGRSR